MLSLQCRTSEEILRPFVPGGTLPIMTYTGKPRPKIKGVPFSSLRYMKGKGFHLLKYMKG